MTESSPHHPAIRFFVQFTFWVVLPMIVWNTFFPALFSSGWHPEEENGLMENLQALLLLGGAILFFWNSFKSQSGERMLYAGVGLLHLTFLVLEVDLRAYDLPALNRIFNGRIRDAWLGGIWLLAVWWCWSNRIPTWQAFTRWLRTPAGLFLIIAGGFWVISGVVDKLDPIQPHELNLFVEEQTEVNATWLMLVSAAWTRQLRRD